MARRPVRSFAQRVAALAVAVLLVTAGVLGLRHEADGTHVRDPLTGVMLHGHALAGAHADGAPSDIHGRADDHDADGGACTLDAALHQAATAVDSPHLFAALAPAARAPVALATPRAPAPVSVLRDAPKTSPPARG